MQNDNNKKRFAGKGYYIALIACLAAVGISGYVFVQTARNSALEASASATISPAPTQETGEARPWRIGAPMRDWTLPPKQTLR